MRRIIHQQTPRVKTIVTTIVRRAKEFQEEDISEESPFIASYESLKDNGGYYFSKDSNYLFILAPGNVQCALTIDREI